MNHGEATDSGAHPPIFSKPYWRNIHSVCLSAAVLLSVFFAIINPPWCDEVAYVDPGAQLALTGRMFSTAWVTNSPESLWGSSNPGLPLLFAGWFKLIGFGQLQARLLFCSLYLAGVALFFRWLVRMLNPRPWALVLGITSSMLLPSMANAVFAARLEALAFLLFAWFLSYTFNDERHWTRDLIAAATLGVGIIFFGLHFAGFFSLAALLAFVFSPSRRTLFLGLSLAVGLLLGVWILWAVYTRLGIWDIFLNARASHYGRALPWVPIGWNRYYVSSDLAWLLALATLGFFSAMADSGWRPVRTWTAWLWAIGAFFLVPVAIDLIGIYYANYSWMVAIPMMLCFYIGSSSLVGWRRAAFIVILTVELLLTSWRLIRHIPGKIREDGWHQQVVAKIALKTKTGEHVAADFPLYYKLVGAGYRVFTRTRVDDGVALGFEQDTFLPVACRKRISCVVTLKSEAAPVLSSLGGLWILSAEIPLGSGQSEQKYQIFQRK